MDLYDTLLEHLQSPSGSDAPIFPSQMRERLTSMVLNTSRDDMNSLYYIAGAMWAFRFFKGLSNG